MEKTWLAVKSHFFEASALSLDAQEQFLKGLDLKLPLISSELRELLVQDPNCGPDILRPCWDPEPKGGASSKTSTIHRFPLGLKLNGRFEIIELLGVGGLGEVYRALDHQQSCQVALKTLRNGLISGREAFNLLSNELNTARAISHRNVCRLFDVHWPDDEFACPYFSMELIEGETLLEFIRKNGALRVSECLPIVLQMLDGLEAAHNMGIVHRDFKSSNVLISSVPHRVVVMDFGIARPNPVNSDDETFGSNSLAGTPAYMAPEQLVGKRATFASDIHAMGVVLFEMVTGRKPFLGATVVEVASQRLHAKVPSPRSLTPGLDRKWESAILACLDRDPAKRPQSVQQLRELLVGAPSKISRRSLFLTGAFGFSGATAAVLFFNRSGSEQPRLEIADFENPGSNPDVAYLCRQVPAELARLLGGFNRFQVVLMRQTAAARSQPNAGRFLLDGTLSQTATREFRLLIRLFDQDLSKPVWSKNVVYPPPNLRSDYHLELAQSISIELTKYSLAHGTTIKATAEPGMAPGSSSAKGSALDKYMRARYLLEESSLSGARAAENLLREAVKEDPTFSLAWAALADTCLLQTAFITGDSKELIEQALSSARTAVSLDPQLAEAHASLAAVSQHLMDWPAADQSYRAALRLKPIFPRAHRWYAGFVLQFGRFEEAQEHGDLALKQDPYDKMGPTAVGLYRLFSGRPEEAVKLIEPAVEGRDVEGLRHNLGQAYARCAQLAQGAARQKFLRLALAQASKITAIEKRKESLHPLLSDRLLSLIYAIAGDITLLEPVQLRLDEDVRSGLYSAADAAWPYAILHNYPVALDMLEASYRTNPRSLLYIKVNPFLENLKGQPRFERLLRDLQL